MNNVFELINVSNEQVVIKVNADDNLTVAMNPYISKEYDYITVTRGKNHTLTVIKNDGKTFSFDWGYNGYTLISNNLKRLRKEVENFIKDNYILLESKRNNFTSVKVFYNSNYKKWQIRFNDDSNYWSDKAENVYDIQKEASHWVNVKQWMHYISETGIDVWKAIL